MTFELNIIKQRYGQKVVLENIAQSFASGAIHGFLGENGAGKTTLFQCIANMLPYEGKQMMTSDIRFGFLPAELFMYPMITGLEFLRFYVTARDISWDYEKVKSLNLLFGLPLNEYAETYSTGMLKKLYLMGLLLQKNDVLLLDEPFNGLDFRSSAFVTALLVEYKKQGNTVFVASHDMEHLISYSDTLSLLKAKRLLHYPDKAAFERVKQNILDEAQLKAMDLERIIQ